MGGAARGRGGFFQGGVAFLGSRFGVDITPGGLRPSSYAIVVGVCGEVSSLRAFAMLAVRSSSGLSVVWPELLLGSK